jgi:hypothetical protein
MYHPFTGDTIIYSLGAYSMEAGRTWIAPGKRRKKTGRKTDVGKRCGHLTSSTIGLEFLYHSFLEGNTEIGNA